MRSKLSEYNRWMEDVVGNYSEANLSRLSIIMKNFKRALDRGFSGVLVTHPFRYYSVFDAVFVYGSLCGDFDGLLDLHRMGNLTPSNYIRIGNHILFLFRLIIEWLRYEKKMDAEIDSDILYWNFLID